MLGAIKRYLWSKKSEKIASSISALLSSNDRVLDFGCGNMLIAKFILQKLDVKIIGIDVGNINLTELPITIYDGKRIPFKDKYFDVTYAIFVFHHIENIELLFTE
ncbi:MAG: methyltransferase domain-containing protein, partial [Nanoarchaeota archaeon]